MPSILPKSLQRRPWLLTLLAGVLAYFLCLRADFYMDDFMFVVNSEGNGPPQRFFYFFGLFTIGDTTKFGFGPTEALPTLLHALQYSIAGPSPVASHLMNLLIHLGSALALCFLGPDLLRRLGAFRGDEKACSTAALAGSVIFACHPLASEAVNYAKCINIQLVTVFSLWFARSWLAVLQGEGGSALRSALISGFLLTISYHPGIFLGISLAAFLALANPERLPLTSLRAAALRWWRSHSRFSRALIAGSAGPVTLGLAVWLAVLVHNQVINKAGDYPVHLLTQGRVVWQYLWRFFVPVNLCSDHAVPLSVPGEDLSGLLQTVAFGLLFAGLCVVAIAVRAGLWRLLATLAVLWLAPLAIRFAYSNLEPMVEYRAYPALPWFCMLCGLGFSALWQCSRLRLTTLGLAAAAATAGIVLSAARSHQWRDRSILASDVLRKYKTNTRALLQLIVEDYKHGDYEGVRTRHDGFALVWQNLRSAPPVNGRAIDKLTLDVRLIVSCKYAALAMAEEQGSKPALKWTEEMLANLREVMPQRFSGPAPDSKVLEDLRTLLIEKGPEIDARFGNPPEGRSLPTG